MQILVRWHRVGLVRDWWPSEETAQSDVKVVTDE